MSQPSDISRLNLRSPSTWDRFKPNLDVNPNPRSEAAADIAAEATFASEGLTEVAYEVKGFATTEEEEEEPQISPATAMMICLIAGLCGCLWSPLSTFARAGDSKGAKLISDPYVCLVLFTFGQLLAFPSVSFIAGRLGGTGVRGPLRELDSRSIFWGFLTGMTVSGGYIGYYMGSTIIPATACFGMANCNPILALLLDVFVSRSFDGATNKVKKLLVACILAYLMAILLLVLSG